MSAWRRLFEKVDISFLAYFRIVFGLIMFWEVIRYFNHGWIAQYWINPPLNFTYFGFSWVKPWPGIGMYLHMAVLGLLSLGITIGWYYRKCAILFFLGFSYIFLLEQARYLNHFYLIFLISFLMIFLPANRCYSVDVRRNPALGVDRVPAWTLWLLRFQISLPYLYGGFAKLTPDWLQGEPMRIWTAHKIDLVWAPLLLSYGGLLLDLLIVPALLWKRTRPAAYAVVVLFHLTNAWLFRIGIFPWLMIGATALFFSPNWPRQIFFNKRLPLQPALPKTGPPTKKEKTVLLALGCYIFFQLFFPFRHYLYPGLVHWSEEGHRFAWHMKLRDKIAEGFFFVRNSENQETWTIDPKDILPKWQVRKMMIRPDLILQFCYFLADQKRKEGVAKPEVYAVVMTSLNGREFSYLVDPEVNLANEPRTLWPASWIMPLGREKEEGVRSDRTSPAVNFSE